MKDKTCCFTGHRKIPPLAALGLKRKLEKTLKEKIEQGYLYFGAGGALGFDTLAAKLIIRFKLSHPDARLRIVAPCRNQSDSWSKAQVGMYEYTLSNADEIEYMTDEYEDGCMRLRNQRLADSCDLMIAYVARPYSGAAQTVRMADKAGKKIYNIYPSLG